MSKTAVVQSAYVKGVDAIPVEVWVVVENGAPMTHLYGVQEPYSHAVRETVRAGIKSAGFAYPNMRVSVHVRSDEERQVGEGIDLAIAIGILRATGQIPTPEDESYLYVGEIMPNGDVRAVRGMPSIARMAEDNGHIYIGGGKHENTCAISSSADTGAEYQIPGTVCDQLFIRNLRELHQGTILEECTTVEQEVVTQPDVSDLLDDQTLADLADAVKSGERVVFETEGASLNDLHRLGEVINYYRGPMSQEEMFQSAANLSAGKEDIMTAIKGIRPIVPVPSQCTAIGVIGGGASVMPGLLGYAHTGVALIEDVDALPSLILNAIRTTLPNKSITLVRATGRYVIPANVIFLVNRQNSTKELMPAHKLNRLLEENDRRVFKVQLRNTRSKCA